MRYTDRSFNETKIKEIIEEGKSTDFIVGMFSNKRSTNTDEILKIIRDYKWNKWKKEGIKL
tara:strand:- start:619 stop:801 length:183 start_codon:yes stop_codon:yes gene_type:complete